MKKFTILLILFLSMGTLMAADKEPIGKVVAVEGKAEANKRNLSRGSGIFVSDLIKVAAKGKIQIRFTDGGILNLIELTEYKIDSYQFNKTGTDTYTANLIKGGFRELTGDIGKKNPDQVKVKTPVATIGIRGTTFAANMQGGQVYFGCDSGSLSISNAAGERTLNSGEFVSASSFNQLGEVTTERPDALSSEIFAAPEGGETMEEAEPTEASPAGEAEEPAAEEGEPIEEEQLEVPEHEGNPPC